MAARQKITADSMKHFRVVVGVAVDLSVPLVQPSRIDVSQNAAVILKS
jgi:hypothetical protein